MINLFKHTSRSYWDVYNALIAAYPKKPTWIFKEMAGLFDFQSELMNRVATDILYPTTREASYSFANLCDYSPIEADGAEATLTITLTSAMAKTLAIGYQVGGKSTATGKVYVYELTATGDSGGTATITVAAKQKRSYTSKSFGTISNSDDFADYPIDGYTNIIKDSMSIVVGTDTWTRVDNFDDSGTTDKHFVLIYQSGGQCRFGFGDGVTGQKPTIGEAVYGSFEVTEGLIGRLEAGEININMGGDSNISSITNAESTGGNDSETISSILRNARANVRLKDAIWTVDDLESAARLADGSVVKAYGDPALGSADVYIVYFGGTNASAGRKAAIEVYMEALTPFGLYPIAALDAYKRTTSITATFTLREDFDELVTTNLLEFAMTLASCSYDLQVIDSYNDSGIDTCREDVINVLWDWGFTEDENDGLALIISKWIDLLGEREYRDFGQALEVGDLWIMGDFLYEYGVDEFNLVSPTSNVTMAANYISETGALTITSGESPTSSLSNSPSYSGSPSSSPSAS